jgi:hypothetical protein
MQREIIYISWKPPQKIRIELDCDAAYKKSMDLAYCVVLFETRMDIGVWDLRIKLEIVVPYNTSNGATLHGFFDWAPQCHILMKQLYHFSVAFAFEFALPFLFAAFCPIGRSIGDVSRLHS